MRIVYLHQYFNTRARPGGTRSYEMARRLVAAGHEVHVVTSRREGSNGGAWVRSDEDGIAVHWLPVAYSHQMVYRDRLLAFGRFAWGAAFKAANLEADVVFATSTPLTIALPGAYAARRARAPMVLEVRDLWPEVPIALGVLRSRATIAAARWLERFAYRHAASVVALSPDMAAGVARAGYPADRITVIPNACDNDLFDVGPEPGRALRAAHPWLGDRPLVVYTGTFGYVNGVSYFARLAAAVSRHDPEIRFLAIGDGREEAQVRACAAELGVLDRSFFVMPPRPKHEMPAWLSAADLATSFVIDVPALWANSANKVFDGFAAGKPVAINHEGWQADLLRRTGAGFVLPPRDVDVAARTLLAVVRDGAGLARAGAAAKVLAAGVFSRDHLGLALERVLRAATGARRTGAEPTATPTPPRPSPVGRL